MGTPRKTTLNPLDFETAEEQQARRRARKAARQQRWRARAAEHETAGETGASVTMHLTDEECGALDMIAARLYRQHPHDPVAGVLSPVFPGRPEAVRELVRDFLELNQDAEEPASRQACADFWRAEASWRRVSDPDTTHEAPEPPWGSKRARKRRRG
jgi:hypothetical protein